MENANIEVKAECPICHNISSVDIPHSVVQKAKSRIITVHIDQSIICEHQFLIFFDREKKTVIGSQKLDFYAQQSETMQNSIISTNDLSEQYGLETIKQIFHSLLLKRPIILIHDIKEKQNRAQIWSSVFQPVLPETLYHNFDPFIRVFSIDDAKRYGLSGLEVKKDLTVENIHWEPCPLVFETYLLQKVGEFIDPDSQRFILETELAKLVPICQWTKKQIENWGAVSADEIMLRFDVFDRILQKEEMLMEFLQIIKYTDFSDIDGILIAKNYKLLTNFYKKIR